MNATKQMALERLFECAEWGYEYDLYDHGINAFYATIDNNLFVVYFLNYRSLSFTGYRMKDIFPRKTAENHIILENLAAKYFDLDKENLSEISFLYDR